MCVYIFRMGTNILFVYIISLYLIPLFNYSFLRKSPLLCFSSMRFLKKSPTAGAGVNPRGIVIALLTVVTFLTLLLLISSSPPIPHNVNAVKLKKEGGRATPSSQKLHHRRMRRPSYVLQSSKRKVPNASDPLHNR